MLARIEVVVRPELVDPAARRLIRRIELSKSAIRSQIRWARLVDVVWLDLPISREAMMSHVQELFWDPVSQWLFTGNLIPSAAGKSGGLPDIMEASPIRPGKFWAIEKRFRPGVMDSVARDILQAFEIVGRQSYPGARVATGKLLLLEGAELNESSLGWIAKEVFCNDRIETWSLFDDSELRKNSRFDQERVRRDIPRPSVPTSAPVLGRMGQVGLKSTAVGQALGISSGGPLRGQSGVNLARNGTVELGHLTDDALSSFSKERNWDLTQAELFAVRDYFTGRARDDAERARNGLQAPTEVELELVARSWSEPVRHTVFQAEVDYRDDSGEPDPAGHAMPHRVEGLFRSMIAGTTEQLPKSWLISVPGAGLPSSHQGGDGMIALDDDTAFAFGVEVEHSLVSSDAAGGSEGALLDLQRRLLTEGFGTKLHMVGGVMALPHAPAHAGAAPSAKDPLPTSEVRRALDGMRVGLERATSRTGVPFVNGGIQWSDLPAGASSEPSPEKAEPALFLFGAGLMPKRIGDRRCESPELFAGDRLIGVGRPTGRDGLAGASFVGAAVPQTHLSDVLTHKRLSDFLLAIRELGIHRSAVSLGVGGLGVAVARLGRLTGGVSLDLSQVAQKGDALSAAEVMLSETRERVLLAVPPERVSQVEQVAKLFELPTWNCGELTHSGRFEAQNADQPVVSLDLDFILEGAPKLTLQASWAGRPPAPEFVDLSFEREALPQLLGLLGRPNIASKEWLIRQLDHEAQGLSVVKPLHTVSPGSSTSFSGPNDGAVIKLPVLTPDCIAVGTGTQGRYHSVDPWLMAQLAVDEAVRNVLCVGGEYGRPESVLALSSNFAWPLSAPKGGQDPQSLGGLLRACQGLQDAALALGLPIVAHQDAVLHQRQAVSRDPRIKQDAVVDPALVIQAISRVQDFRFARTADFKAAGDSVYLLGTAERFGLIGSELQAQLNGRLPRSEKGMHAPRPDWQLARLLYGWVGGDFGDRQTRLKSLHDISEGGLLVSISEGLLARGLGMILQIPVDMDPWGFGFGESFHTFVGSCADSDAGPIEDELRANRIPFLRLGSLDLSGRLDLRQGDRKMGTVDIPRLRSAWVREGYWE